MGKIDFTARKRKIESQQVISNEENELSLEYTSVWGDTKEKIEHIELGRIQPYIDMNGDKQPFKINNERVKQIKESVVDIGIITPLIVRKQNETYQILSGHHRFVVAQQLNMLTVPCVIRNISDEEANIYVTESNIQRIKILPTEYCAIFKKYMDKREEIDMTAQKVANKFGISKKTMYRYINLDKLIKPLQNLVDEELININCIDMLSTLSEDNQKIIFETIKQTSKKIGLPILKNFINICEKRNNHNDVITVEDFINIIENKTNKNKKVYSNKIYNSMAEKYSFDCSEKELDDIVLNLLDDYFKKRLNRLS